jgi:hypothetical protein
MLKLITSICYEVGYNNLSNFNWQFPAEKGMKPSRFRRLLLDNIKTAKAENGGFREEHINHRRRYGTAQVRRRARSRGHFALKSAT